MPNYRATRKVGEAEVIAELATIDEVREFLNTDLEADPTGTPETKPAKRGRGRPAGSTTKGKGKGKKTETPAASEPAAESDLTHEALRLGLTKIVEHEKGGGPMAREILNTVGKAKKVEQVAKENFQALYDATIAKLKELDGDGDDDDDNFL